MCTARFSRPFRRLGYALVVVLGALLLSFAAPASGAMPAVGATPASTGVTQDSVSEIAKRLAKSPVYVDQGYQAKVPPARQRELARQIEKTGINLKVVLVSFRREDRWSGDAKQFAGALRDRLDVADDEHLILLTPNSWYGKSLSGFEWPDDHRYDASYAAMAVGVRHEEKSIPLARQLSRTIEIIDAGSGMQEYEEARKDNPLDLGEGEDDGGVSPALVAGLGALVLLLAGALGWSVWRRRRAPGRRASLPPHVYAAAREADEDAVRRQAQDEVLRFGEELRAHESTADEQTDPAPLRLALDAYDAARRVLDDSRELPDLVGVLALVVEGRDALADDDRKRKQTKPGPKGTQDRAPQSKGTQDRAPRVKDQPPTRPLPLCFFHPLHGRATIRVHWRALGHREALDVATCKPCAHAVKHRRVPEVLTDRYSGQSVPYYDVPAEHSLWTATGYGSFGDEPLASRVQRGDFTRAAEARARTQKAN